MWAPLGISNFILKTVKSAGDCSVYLSNFVQIWSARLTDEEIITISKEMNPRVEAPQSKMIEKVLSFFHRIEIVNKKLEETEGQLILFLESNLSGIKFQFKLNLKLQSPEMLFTQLTLPLILLAARLKIRENILINTITKKDAEIDEYRRENTIIKRSHLITKEFSLKDLAEREKEQGASSLPAVMHNPSSLLGLIDEAMFESILDYDLGKDNFNVNEKIPESVECRIIDVPNSKTYGNAYNNKMHGKIEAKNRKVKNKIDIQIISGAKKKKGNVSLKL